MSRRFHWMLEVSTPCVFPIGRRYANYFFAFSPNLNGMTIDNSFGVLHGRVVIGKIEANRGSRNVTIVFENKETIDSHSVPPGKHISHKAILPDHLSPGKYAFALMRSFTAATSTRRLPGPLALRCNPAASPRVASRKPCIGSAVLYRAAAHHHQSIQRIGRPRGDKASCHHACRGRERLAASRRERGSRRW